ncbi:MAG: thioredoxin domain-containing protein [Syntrophorhabdaceae bacterium]|nr:thioredoxin domain-containing protein [Syntrophorhabdaceae bacterium]
MRKIASLSIVAVLFFIFYFFYGISYAQTDEKKDFLPSFGNGKITVRLYADYFCGPCSFLEPRLDPIIKKLVKKNKVNVTFIDVPFHKHSSIYVKYFLYALNEKKNLEHTLKVRTVLFNAAKERVTEPSGLEAYLKKNDINIKPFDERYIYEVFERYMNREDKINATPSCVIIDEDKKETYKGANDIINALERLN